jgi:ABC-2 type transport system permease protein
VNNVPGWLEVISKLNPLTYGVDAIRQLFLAGNVAAAGGSVSTLGVNVMGHNMTILEDMLVVLVLGVVLLLAAAWSFSKQE